MISSAASRGEERRGFFRWMALSLGGLIGMVPGVSGLVVLLDPLMRRSGGGGRGFQRVTALDALQVDAPRRFTMEGVIRDAWNQFQTDLGAVYLVRRADEDGQPVVDAFQVICPHAGCSVSYHESSGLFECPCHDSAFRLDGGKVPGSVAARGLDRLDVQVNNGDVLVKYVKFKEGNKPESIPV